MPPPPANDTQALAVLRALADLLRYPFDDGVPSSATRFADELDAALQAGDRDRARQVRTKAADWVKSQHYLVMDRLVRTLEPGERAEAKKR
jgi:hypothetical protein